MSQANELYDPQLAATIELLRIRCEALVINGCPRDCLGFAALVLAVENLYRMAADQAVAAGISIPTLDEEVWQDIAQQAAAVIGEGLDAAANGKRTASN